jgi:hypothetical protein
MTKLQPWTTPDSYAGYDPVGHYGVYTIHRDSELLDRVNMEVAIERLQAAGATVENYNGGGWSSRPDEAPMAYIWDASHWMVGWVRYLMVRPDAPPEVIAAAEEIVSDLEDYPILDEDRWSQAEVEAADEYWKGESVRSRVEWIKMANEWAYEPVSIFAARLDYVPENDGRLDELMREGL